MSEGKNKQSIIAGKAYAFALNIIKLYKQLTTETKNMFFLNNYLGQGLQLEQM